MLTLKERLSKKSILNLEGIEFFVIDSYVVAYFEDLKLVPLKESHIDLLEQNSIAYKRNVFD
jgi:hypothetical protein